MRDLIVALFGLGAIPVAFARPMAGLLAFSLFAYMRLQDLAWGFASNQRWSLFLAVAMVAGWFFQRNRAQPIWNLRTGLMAFMLVWTSISLLLATGLDTLSNSFFINFAKVIFVAVFTTALVQRREHLRVFMWVVAMSFAFYGVKSGAQALLSGGSPILQGPGGMMKDNNDFALALAMAVPLIVGLATSEVNGYYRRWLKIFVPLTYLAVFATRSRGGFLAITLGTLVLVWRSKNRFAGLATLGTFMLLGTLVLPSDMFERLNTLKNVEADGSASGRLKAWGVAGEVIKDYPLFGVGTEQFQKHYLDYGERAGTKSGTRVVHNAYLQIWSESGTPVFLAYVAMLAAAVLSVQRLRRRAERVYARSWISSYCTALEGALLTFMLGSVFLNRAHFDLTYHLIAMTVVLDRIASAELDAPRLAEQSRPESGGAFRRPDRYGFDRRPSARRSFRTSRNAPTQLGGGAGFASPMESH
jgi:putative inorganic carbon (HCO3(-)) transporter